jgi:hypothetical protein
VETERVVMVVMMVATVGGRMVVDEHFVGAG